MDKEDVLRERINSLIDNGLLSVEMLQEATGIEKDSLEKFLFENGVKLSSDDMKDSQRRLRLFGISDCLIEGMKVPEDERVKGIIDVLVQVYGMSLKMISSYADIEEQEISDFLSGSNQMSYEKKYRLAVKTFSLMQAMRNMPARKACILNEKPLASRQQKLPCKSAKQKEYLPRLPLYKV